MIKSQANRAAAFLASIKPATTDTRRAAAVVCASYALEHPDPSGVLNELLDALGLYETVGEP